MPIRKVQEMEQPGEDKPSLVRAEIQGDTKPCSSVEEFIKPSRDVDEAMKAFRGHEGEVIKIDEATNKRLLRTIDWNLMPLSIPQSLRSEVYHTAR